MSEEINSSIKSNKNINILQKLQGLLSEKFVYDETGTTDINHGTVYRGDTITYIIRVTSYDTEGSIGPIVITDDLPESLENVSAYAFVTTSGGQTFDVPALFSLDNIVTLQTGVYLGANNSWVQASFTVRVKDDAPAGVIYNNATILDDGETPIDLTNNTDVTLFADPEKAVFDSEGNNINNQPVKAEDIITYEISYSNDSANLVDIVITDQLPSGVDFVSFQEDPTFGVYDDTTHTVRWELTNVPTGEGKVGVIASVNENALVQIENTATVVIGNDAPYTTNTVTNQVTPENHEKNVFNSEGTNINNTPIKVNDIIIYEITYINQGLLPLDIVITDALPSGVDFLYFKDGQAGLYDETTHTATWNLTDAPPGIKKVSFVAVVNQSALVQIQNFATVVVGTEEPYATNIVTNQITPDTPKKNVSLDSQSGKNESTVKVGDSITYEISYFNYNETSSVIFVADVLPRGVDFVGFPTGSPIGTYDPDTHTVVWELTSIPPGTRGTVKVITTVNNLAVKIIANYGVVQVGDDDPVFTNLVKNYLKNYCIHSLKTNCRKVINGTVIWMDNDNAEGKRPPAVDINLLRDGIIYKTTSVDAFGDNKFEFACLPIWKNSGNKYLYEVDELIVPGGYSKIINGYDITEVLR